MAATRAEGVAEALWELKRADKLACYSKVANRAGFSAGANGRSMLTCIKAIRKDWPHLEWWRAIRDDITVEAGTDHVEYLQEWGVTVEDGETEGRASVGVETDQLMDWNPPTEETESDEEE